MLLLLTQLKVAPKWSDILGKNHIPYLCIYMCIVISQTLTQYRTTSSYPVTPTYHHILGE